MDMNIIEEHKPSKIAAVFPDENTARTVEQQLLQKGDFDANAVEIIRPGDQAFSKKIEPDSAGIVHTLLKSHLLLGIAGVIAGMILAGLLIRVGPQYIQSSPIATFLALSFFGLLGGMMLAGAISLRPDHDPLINKAAAASQDKNWTVVVQADNRNALAQAKQLLQPQALSISETL